MPNVIIHARILHSIKKGYYRSADELESDIVDYLEKHSQKKFDSLGKYLNDRIRKFLDGIAPAVKRYFSKGTVTIEGAEVTASLSLDLPNGSEALIQPEPKGENWFKIVIPIGKQQETRLFDTLAWWNGFTGFLTDWRKAKGRPQPDEGTVGERYIAVWDLVRNVALDAIAVTMAEMQAKELEEEAKTLGLEEPVGEENVRAK